MLYPPQDHLAHERGRDVVPDLAVLDALLDDVGKQDAVFLDEPVGLADVIVGEAPDLQHQDLCEDAVGGIDVDVGPDGLSELIEGPLDAVELVVGLDDVMLHVFGKDLVEEVALVFEILVDERLGDPGVLGDLGGGDGVEVLFAQEQPQRIGDLCAAGGVVLFLGVSVVELGDFKTGHDVPSLNVSEENGACMSY